MNRLYYLDNLRGYLTMLLIVFHTSIAYGGAGSWIFQDFDNTHGITPTIVVFSLFTGVCQAFFMSLFFFISAYFTPGSFDRKGGVKFLTDRLFRLGLPLLVYYFAIGPITDWFAKFSDKLTLWQFYKQYVFSFEWTFFGPAWFIETLLYFTIIYLVVRLLRKNRTRKEAPLPFPTGRALLCSAVLFGLIAFIVRLWYPTGTGPLELQLGYFPLYILFLILGTVAFRNNWLENLPEKLVRVWKWIAVAMIIAFPIGLISLGALNSGLTISGGMNAQAFVYAMWEPFVCFGINLWLILFFKQRFNLVRPFTKALSEYAYTMYLIHPPIVVGWTIAFIQVPLPSFIKFLIVAPLSVVSCFAIANIICKIPYVKRVL